MKKAEHLTPSIFAFVEVKDSENWAMIDEYLINYSNHETKLWLTKLHVWALTNNKTITLSQATPVQIASRKLFTPTA